MSRGENYTSPSAYIKLSYILMFYASAYTGLQESSARVYIREILNSEGVPIKINEAYERLVA
jgi:hypothetical protein